MCVDSEQSNTENDSQQNLHNNLNHRSIDDIKALLTVVFGLGLVESVKSLITNENNLLVINLSLIPIFVAFLATLLPFYQGNCKYMDTIYLQKNLKALDGIMDTFVFIAQGIIFYVMAIAMKQPKFFFLAAIVLYISDIIWLGFVSKSNSELFPKLKNWLIINIFTLFILLILYYTPLLLNDYSKWWIISLVMLARTGADYIWTWSFYWCKSNLKKIIKQSGRDLTN